MPLQTQSSELRPTSSYADVDLGYVEPSRGGVDYDFSPSIESPVTTFGFLAFKRVFDLVVTVLISPFVLSVVALIAVAVALESPGPIFFSHRRIHRGGAYFSMWKFRTMCLNSAEVLSKHLEEHPEDREEWALNHKLKNDPRVSRLGLFLRRTSLDELPQIWNVFTGTMSIVGPRPIVTAEVEKYGADFAYYTMVKPGITGLWQASGRSTLTYPQRVALDRRYVEHWTPWLEIKILIRTVRVVFNMNGAY
ncbi:sugar transferase [Granulicella sibirica]|uniref:Undecaprenyl-phosphate galactosephosphotransferase n=1 Tax=Granulicella sibirica TaxID=2479048 RepID=A0A4Q0T3Y6_9BACT|nr:sugar transferase [Granulicella sibirica]RXH58435.1 Undecaprenyl-phosphate galactosephosphotransferase [Granulicella sibirica]